jgi:hypothetical protein
VWIPVTGHGANVVRSHGQPKRGDPPALGLGRGLVTPRRRKPACYKMLRKLSDLPVVLYGCQIGSAL